MLEEVIEETVMESNTIVKAIENAIEEHRFEVYFRRSLTCDYSSPGPSSAYCTSLFTTAVPVFSEPKPA